MGRASGMRAISYLVAAVALTIAVLVGSMILYNLMQSQVAAYSRGTLSVEVKPVTTDTTTYLSIIIRNVGGSTIGIERVFVDNIDVTEDFAACAQLGSSSSGSALMALSYAASTSVILGPGDVYQCVINLGQVLPGGKHVVIVVYTEGGKSKMDIYSFVV